MSVNIRYILDPSGSNPDNYVSGELHTLGEQPVRILVPRYGPFFTKDVVIYDHITQRVLVKGVDYRVPVISREATIRFGLEIADAILIENQAVSTQVRVSYQVLGGDYQNNIDNIVAMWQQVMDDSRNVDWVTGIYGKPSDFPPSPHPHWLSDIYGWEPMTFQIERLAQAIMLGNAPGFEMILQSLRRQMATMEEVEEGERLQKFLTLEGLIHATDKYNFNTITITPATTKLHNNGSVWFDVVATHVPENERWYWTIKHETSEPADFVLNSGILNMVNGKGRFMIQSPRDTHAETNETFRLEIRRNSPTGMVLLTTQPMTLLRHAAFSEDSLLTAYTTPSITNPRMKPTAKVYAANMSVWNSLYA